MLETATIMIVFTLIFLAIMSYSFSQVKYKTLVYLKVAHKKNNLAKFNKRKGK